MNAMSLQQASANLPRLVESTINNREETLIVADAGNVVMIDNDYWEEIQETLRLLRDKKALTALLAGHQQRAQGEAPSGKSIGEVFLDLQD
jgi:PHD/YefM family antitoxin component YafN of YafNO toxin-antitoxin module